MRFSTPETGALAALSDEDWKKALAFCDRTQLTLPLGLTQRDLLPGWVRQRIETNLAHNVERWKRAQTAYREVDSAFRAEGLDGVILKGFSQYPLFVDDPRHRAQYDFDLLFRREQALRARDVARGLGFESLQGFEDFPLDHLPRMVRKTGWEWRGEFFDVDNPFSLELHFQLWSSETERLEAKGLEAFWDRIVERRIEDLAFRSLDPADSIAYAALHALRHLLRGELRPSHIYEIGWMLHRRANDSTLWGHWLERHDPSLRRLEAVCFALAHRWFDCELPEAAGEEIERLPHGARRWMEECATSPLAGRFRPNKDEIWLHWSLLDSFRDRAAVIRRRLVPERLPTAVDAIHLPDERITWRVRVRKAWRYAAYVRKRVAHHLRSLGPTAVTGARWLLAGTGLEGAYWRFFLAAACFNFGYFIFFFLYNLYLLQMGFHEDFLGLVSSAMTLGSLVGALGAAVAFQRFGIRNTLLVCFPTVAALSVMRSVVIWEPALVGLAFLSGVALVSWGVAVSPAIAQLAKERDRPLAFSLLFSSGIGVGVVGGFAGGRLPGWFSQLSVSKLAAYRYSLFTGCAIVLLAMAPLSRVKLGRIAAGARQFYRPSPRVVRFLAAMAVWGLGTGALNPFLSAFFAHLRIPVERIGNLFATAHVAQAAAMLLAPLALRRFGLLRGISGMQFATALALLGLAVATGQPWIVALYVAFTMAQYMTEPGTFAYLMDGIPPEERNSASGLNLLTSSAAQAIAAYASGRLIARFGYSPVLAAGSITCAIAALLFRALPEERLPDAPSGP